MGLWLVCEGQFVVTYNRTIRIMQFEVMFKVLLNFALSMVGIYLYSGMGVCIWCVIKNRDKSLFRRGFSLRFSKGGGQRQGKRGAGIVTESLWGCRQATCGVPETSWERSVLRWDLKEERQVVPIACI